MNNVNNNYFEGQYKDIWRSIIPVELTGKEVDFMVSYFTLGSNSKVLDLMCGYGRHAIGLGRKGISVTSVDNLPDYIEEINDTAQNESLPVRAVCSDVLSYNIEKNFDLAICMGNSLNFFNYADAKKLLTNIQVHLKPGGHLLINTWSLAEIAIKSFTPRSWDEVNGVKHVCESRYLFHPTRIEFDSTFITSEGIIEEKTAVDYIFSIAEMELLLGEAGFALQEIFSIPGKREFSLGDPRAYIIAKRQK